MEKIIRRRKCRNTGSLLALALVIVLVLAIIGFALLRLGFNARLQAIRDVRQISARSAADAGIEHAVRYMIDQWNSSTSKATWLATWEDATDWTDPAVPATAVGYTSPVIQIASDSYGGAEFQYKIYKSTRPKGYQIESVGTAGGMTRTVHAAAVLKSSYIGVGAREDIYLAPNVNLATIPSDGKMIVQTNGTDDKIISVKPGVTVPGDVVSGPGSDPDDTIFNQGTVLGQEMAAEEEIEFDSIESPTSFTPTILAADPVEPNKVVIGSAGVSTAIQLDEMYFGSGPLTAVDTIEIYGNVDIYVDGTTYLTPGTTIVVADNSTLDLYLGGNLWAQPGSSIIYGGETVTDAGIIEAATNISIKGTVVPGTFEPLCEEIHFQPDGDFFGTIYAPDASIELWPNGDFYGAVVGGYDLEIKPGGSFYYIPSLVQGDDIEILYMGIKFGSWWEHAN